MIVNMTIKQCFWHLFLTCDLLTQLLAHTDLYVINYFFLPKANKQSILKFRYCIIEQRKNDFYTKKNKW